MRRLLSLKLLLAMVAWTALCGVLYLVLSVGEAALEIGGSAAGGALGPGADFSGVAEVAGDALQFVLGAVWAMGLFGLWIARRLVRSRRVATAAAPVIPRAVPRVAPFMRQPRSHGLKRVLSGPSGRLLSRMVGRKS